MTLLLIFIFPILTILYCIPARASSCTTFKRCSFNGISVFTESYNYNCNKEEAIIFIHGLGGNHQDASFLYHQKNKHMIISMDMPNHGESGKLVNANWDLYVDSVKAVVKEYNLKRIHLVGHSLGADTAMMYAYNYPDEVSSIVLIDRAYYNFTDLYKYQFTPSFYKVVEYDKQSDMDKKIFDSFIDMLYYNDIKKTWDISKEVLLIAADPYWPSLSNITEFISSIKENPSHFGFTKEEIRNLPTITLENLNAYMKFLEMNINEFEHRNKRFSIVKTPFDHSMVHHEDAKPYLLSQILIFIENSSRGISF